MGGNDQSGTKTIDASVGGLVWVRRRNGSWWPGRIVSHDEVNEQRLVSPRAGTPVKLLGRSDASVDWYNLEKSKRVKPFRCGEFDAAIKTAKAAAASTNKKAVKYARREDAILHALEIESSLLGKDPPDVHRSTENSCMDQSSSPEEAHAGSSPSSKVDENVREHPKACVEDSDSELGLSQSGISFEEPKHAHGSKGGPGQGKRRKTPSDLEDDGTEGTKRMRGLEDLGMGVVLQQVNEESSLAHDVSAGNVMSDGQQVCSSSVRRKRSRSANANEVLKRKNRRRQLTKVLESTAMVSVPVVCDQIGSSSCSSLGGLGEVKVSDLETNAERKSLSATINNSSDSTGASLGNHKAKDGELMSVSSLADNDSYDILFDVPFVAEDKHTVGIAQVDGSGMQSGQNTQVEASKEWQLKRKRNSRNPSQNRKQDSTKHVQRTTLSSHYPGWNASRGCLTPASPADGSGLYDVELKEETVKKRQGVPMVQLTSRFSGKPIVGHPVAVDVMADGYCNLLLSRRKDSKAFPDMVGTLDGTHMAKRSSIPPKKTIPRAMKSSKSRSVASKSSKARKSASSSKKTKRLSSLTRQKHTLKGKNNQLLPKKPVVACIPVKLVFSRLNEALNGTAKQAHRALPAAST